LGTELARPEGATYLLVLAHSDSGPGRRQSARSIWFGGPKADPGAKPAPHQAGEARRLKPSPLARSRCVLIGQRRPPPPGPLFWRPFSRGGQGMGAPLQGRQQATPAAWHGWDLRRALRLLILPADLAPFSYPGEKPPQSLVRCIRGSASPWPKQLRGKPCPGGWKSGSTPAHVGWCPGPPCAALVDGLGGVEMNLEQNRCAPPTRPRISRWICRPGPANFKWQNHVERIGSRYPGTSLGEQGRRNPPAAVLEGLLQQLVPALNRDTRPARAADANWLRRSTTNLFHR